MKKDSPICFRVSSDLRESLAQIAKKDRRSLSSTIETILINYLKDKKAFHGFIRERRKYPRKDLSVSAVISQPESGTMGVGTIANISLDGVGVLIPKDFKQQILIDEQNSKFEIVFNIPVENKPIKLSCDSNRITDDKDIIHVGAYFIDADFKSYKTLQTYLT